jgi:hypothetical protein
MSFQGFVFPSEKFDWLIEYLFLALECSTSVVAAFYFNYQFALQGNIVQAILSFGTDPDNPLSCLKISLRQRRRGLTMAIAEAAVKLLATRQRNYSGLIIGNVAFANVETRSTRVGIVCLSECLAGNVALMVKAMNRGGLRIPKIMSVYTGLHFLGGLPVQDIWIVDGFHESVHSRLDFILKPRSGEKVILCQVDKDQESELVIAPFYK